MSVEASCRKYLDAIAKQIALTYNFPQQFAQNPTIGDVFRAIDNNSWNYSKKRKRNARQTPLDQLFPSAVWNELRQLNQETNLRIHDGKLRLSSSGKSMIILPHSKFQKSRITRLKQAAQISGLVSDVSAVVVKDEQDISSSSSDGSQ
jgi:hypothetical protein